MSHTTRYRAYGQLVESSLSLPQFETIETTAPPDVTIRRGTVDLPPDAATTPTPYHQDGDDLYVDVTMGSVRVTDGERVVVDPAPDADPDLFRWTVVGAAFNFLLHQRGYLVLHASVVSVDGGAVAFLGSSGAGKSTTATAFLEAGYDVIADDVAAVTVTDAGPTVAPGFPALKLDRSVVDDLDLAVDAVEDADDDRDRRFYSLSSDGEEESVPVAAVFVLADGETVEVSPLEPRERVLELVRHSYAARAFGVVDGAETNVSQCGRLAEAVPVRRLTRPRSMDALPAVVDAVEAACDRC
jgi:hypothetical protein